MDLPAVAEALIGGVLIGAGAVTAPALQWPPARGGGHRRGAAAKIAGRAGLARAAFVIGLLGGGIVFGWVRPSAFAPSPVSLPLAALAGVAVGFGARLGGGCTSGHGICGVSRVSRRSIAATLTFMSTGALVVGLLHILRGTHAEFSIPAKTALDWQLVVGSAVFGAGWGLAGYCPGPVIAALGSGGSAALVFAGGMLGGMAAYGVWSRGPRTLASALGRDAAPDTRTSGAQES